MLSITHWPIHMSTNELSTPYSLWIRAESTHNPKQMVPRNSRLAGLMKAKLQLYIAFTFKWPLIKSLKWSLRSLRDNSQTEDNKVTSSPKNAASSYEYVPAVTLHTSKWLIAGLTHVLWQLLTGN